MSTSGEAESQRSGGKGVDAEIAASDTAVGLALEQMQDCL